MKIILFCQSMIKKTIYYYMKFCFKKLYYEFDNFLEEKHLVRKINAYSL